MDVQIFTSAFPGGSIIPGLPCAGTGGLGCVAFGIFAGATPTTAGGLFGAGISDENFSGTDLAEDAIGGGVFGAAGGAAELIFG